MDMIAWTFSSLVEVNLWQGPRSCKLCLRDCYWEGWAQDHNCGCWCWNLWSCWAPMWCLECCRRDWRVMGMPPAIKCCMWIGHLWGPHHLGWGGLDWLVWGFWLWWCHWTGMVGKIRHSSWMGKCIVMIYWNSIWGGKRWVRAKFALWDMNNQGPQWWGVGVVGAVM